MQLDISFSWAFGIKWSPSGNTLAYVGKKFMTLLRCQNDFCLCSGYPNAVGICPKLNWLVMSLFLNWCNGLSHM